MHQVDNIQKDLRIAIYGAGEVGLLVKQYIEKNRLDLKIVCFFDKVAKNEIDGVAVYSIKQIQELRSSFDLVFIASCSNISVMDAVLRHYGIFNAIHLVDFFLNEPDLSEDCGNIVEETRIADVQKILASNESLELFELIVKAYNCKHCLKKLSEVLKAQNKLVYPEMREQYLDFIDKDSINTVISGGSYDGGTTLLFLDRLKNVEKVYAFEPMYEKFKCVVNDGIVVNSGKVEIIDKGLFDKTCEVELAENDYASALNLNQQLGYLPVHNIKVVAIDDFVQENSINKVDFIKMDIEGSELAALKGAENTILTHRPQLAICIYHSYDELFDIPFYLENLLEDYKFEVYHYSINSIWESVFYAIPEELCK